MVDKIVAVVGDEIPDSRFYPTARVDARLENGLSACASPATRASTGEGEAHELPQENPKRRLGHGALRAIATPDKLSRVLNSRGSIRQATTSPAGAPETSASPDIKGPRIIALIEEPESARRCLTVALRAARLVDSLTLVALHICVDPDKLISAAEEIELQKMRALTEGTAQERRAQSRRAFDAWLAFSGAQTGWVEQVGSVTSSLLAQAKDAALITIARPHNLDSVDALHAALFDTGRPVLFVPTEGVLPPTLGEHMVIAWKSRAQARKAVMWTMPWLSAAKRITIVTVGEPDSSQDCAQILALLEKHNLSAEVRRARTQRGEHIAARLLSEVEAAGADSMVMGAYRFGQLFEWAFGGVTHEALRQTRIPVFMMH